MIPSLSSSPSTFIVTSVLGSVERVHSVEYEHWLDTELAECFHVLVDLFSATSSNSARPIEGSPRPTEEEFGGNERLT